MISAMAGDIIGSIYEFHNSLPYNKMFAKNSVYTDDTVLTVATADTILNNESFAQNYLDYAQAYPNRGWGGMFLKMIKSGKLKPYNSYGNGSAMRVGPVGWAFNTREEVMEWAKRSAEVSHNHPEGIKGAQAVALSVLLARQKFSKEEIRDILQKEPFSYDLSKKASEFDGSFNETCQKTLPLCFAVFMDSNSFEDAMFLSHAVGGDIDTNNAIIGSICDAYYGLPSQTVIEEVYARIPKNFAKVTTQFVKKYIDKDFVEPKDIGTKTATFEDSVSFLL